MPITKSLVIVTAALLFAYSARAEDAIEKSYDANGNLEESFEKLEPKEGKFRGVMRHYYTNGTLKVEIPIIEAAGELGYAPDGVVKYYYANGQLTSSVQWENEKRNGPFQYFYGNGKLRESGIYTNDISVAARRYNRKGTEILKEPHLHIELDFAEDAASDRVTIYADNYHDKNIHFGWVFAYKLVEEKWERVLKRGRGDSLESRGVLEMTMFNKDDFRVGKWKITISYNVIGAGKLKYIESESQPFRIK